MTSEPIVSITRYTVCLLPRDDINHKYFAVQVELEIRSGMWVIHWAGEYYGDDGTWYPSARRARLFPEEASALKKGGELAPGITVNGKTALQMYERSRG